MSIYSGCNIDVANVPIARGNPYQRLMYSDSQSPFRISPTPSGGIPAMLTLPDSEIPKILHLHWDDRMFGREADQMENRRYADHSISAMREYQKQGGRIIWTIHNRHPHRLRDAETFEWFRQEFVDIADIIHVHAPHARDHMVTQYSADIRKIKIVPHPSYLGVYEPAEATLQREISTETPRKLLFFGMFRGQKGISLLSIAAKKLRRRQQDWELHMVGKAFPSQRRLMRQLGFIEGVYLTPERVPDRDVAAVFANKHAFVAPYQDLFTSGSVLLALTFGLPIIGPDIPEMRQTVPEENWDLLYRGTRPKGLVMKMQKIINMDISELSHRRAACLDYAKHVAPEKISHSFSNILAGLMAERS